MRRGGIWLCVPWRSEAPMGLVLCHVSGHTRRGSPALSRNSIFAGGCRWNIWSSSCTGTSNVGADRETEWQADLRVTLTGALPGTIQGPPTCHSLTGALVWGEGSCRANKRSFLFDRPLIRRPTSTRLMQLHVLFQRIACVWVRLCSGFVKTLSSALYACS